MSAAGPVFDDSFRVHPLRRRERGVRLCRAGAHHTVGKESAYVRFDPVDGKKRPADAFENERFPCRFGKRRLPGGTFVGR